MPTLGVIGAGVVTRLIYPAAIALGIPFRVLAEDQGEPSAAIVADLVVGQSQEDFAKSVDVLITEPKWSDPVDGVAIVAARSAQGQVVIYPAVDCFDQFYSAPANVSEDFVHDAQIATLSLLKERNYVGVLTVTFDSAVKVLHVEEGPSRAGLWTLDGAVTDQFEQHLRAVLNLPFGSPDMLSERCLSRMVLGGEKPELFRPFLHLFARDPGLRVYLYGVEVKPGAEIGHVTVLGSDAEQMHERALHAAGYLNGEIEE